jgi:geranylgeranyl diphosphate synthase type II
LKPYENLFEQFGSHLEAARENLSLKGPRELYQPQNYILSLGGKRLRPMLALIACDLFDGDTKYALQSALCVEMFHNFTLIHDDILDAAPLRRNKETVHQRWNTNIAILSGDALLIQSLLALQKYPQEEYKQLSGLLLRTAAEVCEGQQMDMNFESDNAVTVKNYIEMITLKTAVLLGCSLQMGAINAGTDKASQENIYDFGKNLGIAFQLMDDLLDTYADGVSFGKQIGGDIIANKKTFLLLKAFELANETQEAELRKFMLFRENRAEEKVKGVKKIYDALNIKSLCRARADEHTQKAVECLNRLNINEKKKNELQSFALELLNRQT